MFRRGCIRRERIYSDEGFFVAVFRDQLIYYEGRRKMTITVEMGAHGFAVYSDTIGRWDDDPLSSVTAAERNRIEDNIKRAVESQGQSVLLLN
jgi:hypothetical protein